MMKNEDYSYSMKMFLAATLLLFASLSALAADVQKTVALEAAGTLSSHITSEEKNTITSLKVSGPINGTDVLYLREMAGRGETGSSTDGMLVELDLTDANIVEGGDKYYSSYNTENNVIGANMFLYCKLQSIKLPTSVTSIGIAAFSNCKALTSVTIPSSVTSIGEYVFNECSNLNSIDIPNSVTSISGGAFSRCSKLTSITIPKSVTSIGEGAFNRCPMLTSITVEDGNTCYSIVDNCLIEKSSKLIRACNQASITIPDGVTRISGGAFSYCTNLTSIDIPDGVTSIGGYGFEGCTSLTSVDIPNSVTSMGNYVFSDCSKLPSVTIPSSITSINRNAFSSCTKLTSVTIPSSVTSIDRNAFSGCTKLTSVTIPSSVTSIGISAFSKCTSLTEVTLQWKALPENCATANAFDGVDLSKATLYCKTALLKSCETTSPWSGFGSKEAKPYSITIPEVGIATGCFDDDLNFTDVENVTAYIVSAYSPNRSTVLLTRAKKIPAGTGFIVKGEAAAYDIPAVATDYVYSNMLVGVLEETQVTQTAGDYTNYVLRKSSDGSSYAFVLVPANETVTVPANKAYLQLPTSAVSTSGEPDGAKTSLGLSFDDDDDTTNISAIREKYNGASTATIIYNLNGQRKQNLTKGLNIVNGKKIFVK